MFETRPLAVVLVLLVLSACASLERSDAPAPHDEESLKIYEALPAQPLAEPEMPRKLLVISLCKGYAHDAIPVSARTIKMMGEKTGAFEAFFMNDMEAFQAENLAQFDAVLLNNTTKLAFEHPEHKAALLEFVKSGKGIIGLHAATDNFYDWPEAAEMMGGLFDGHPWGGGGTWAVKIDEPGHTLNRAFEEKAFLISDEIYQFKAPYSRDTHRVLLSLDMSNNRNHFVEGMKRDDRDFAISWIRGYGEGRVFYCSLGHNHGVFQNKAVLKHYLGGIQYALGDVAADDTPSAALEPRPVAARTTDPGAVEDPYTVLLSYQFGSSRMALSNLKDWIRTGSSEQKALIETRLLEILESREATFAGEQYICRLLRLAGTEQSIAVLEERLRDEKLSDAARYAMEGIPSPEVDEAFRDALDDLNGEMKIGVIGSIGRRGDREAVPLLAAYVNLRDPDQSLAAINALGRIGNKEASEALIKVQLVKELKDARDNAYLMCADRALEKGVRSKASKMYREMSGRHHAPAVRAAAWRGVFRTLDDPAPSVATLLKEQNADLQRIAAGYIEELPQSSDLSSITEQLDAFPLEAQYMALAGLGARGDRSAAPAVAELLGSEDAKVRVEAIRALGLLGDATHVAPLARAAATEGVEAAAGRTSLVRLQGKGVDDALYKVMKDGPSGVRAAVIPCLVQRRAPGAFPVLVTYVTDRDSGVRGEALDGLEALATEADLPALFDLLGQVKSKEDRSSLENAIVAACRSVESAVPLVIQGLHDQQGDARASLVTVLGRLPCDEGLDAVMKATEDPEPSVQLAAALALSDWPDERPLDRLLDVADRIEEAEPRTRLLEGCLRMVALPAERSRDAYQSIIALSRTTEEKILVIESVGKVEDAWALDFLKPYLDEAEFSQPAYQAYAAITSALARSVPHEAVGCSVNLASPYTERYDAGGKDALTDGHWGSEQYGDGKWQGFEGVDLDATIDLGKTMEIQSIRVGFLRDMNSWIFLPKEVVFSLSSDGEQFSEVAAIDRPVPGEILGISLEDFYTEVDRKPARYVRVLARNPGPCPEWHPGNGGETWIFADEIQINPIFGE